MSYRNLLNILFTLVTGFMLSACSIKSHINEQVQKEEEKKKTDEEKELALAYPIGLMNLYQLIDSRIAVTNIRPAPVVSEIQVDDGNNFGTLTTIKTVSGDSITEFIESRRALLPSTGNPEAVNASYLLAVGGLAGAFCDRIVIKETGLASGSRTFFPEVDLSNGTPNSVGTDLRNTIVRRFFTKFLMRNETADELAALVTAFSEISSNGNTTAILKESFVATCAAVLSSPEALAY